MRCGFVDARRKPDLIWCISGRISSVSDMRRTIYVSEHSRLSNMEVMSSDLLDLSYELWSDPHELANRMALQAT